MVPRAEGVYGREFLPARQFLLLVLPRHALAPAVLTEAGKCLDKQKISGLKYLFPVSGVRYSLSGQNLHEDVGPGGGAVLGSSAHYINDVMMS